ncbi:MAG: SET domain-containing protein [Parcubacteria group bacterium]|nr:SET domain-containing protein [Parcubacteria group bacterium]
MHGHTPKKPGSPARKRARAAGRPKQRPAAVSVRRAKAGLGLFAEEPIKRGQFVIEYQGRLLSDAKAQEQNTKYLFEINRNWTVDGSSRRNTARYINHSCRPNCEPDTIRHRIKIYALRNIKPGEELVYDYGKEYWEDYIKPHGCRCTACLAEAGVD